MTSLPYNSTVSTSYNCLHAQYKLKFHKAWPSYQVVSNIYSNRIYFNLRTKVL